MTRVSDQERYRRVVEEGSKRRRDLAGYERVRASVEAKALAEREQVLAAMQVDHPEAPRFWSSAVARIRRAVPTSTFALWIEPLQPVGVDDDVLFLVAPDGIRAWVERRYSSLIVEALAEVQAPFTSVSFAEPSSAGGER